MTALLSPEQAHDAIIAACDEIKQMLLRKNAAYGNAVFDPVNVFSKLSAVQGISVRVDDKIQRFRSGHEFPGDDSLR